MSRFMKVALFAAALAVVVVIFRAFAMGPTSAPPAARITFAIDEAAAVGRFQQALRFRTISTQDGNFDAAAFLGLHEFLRTAFPLVHRHLSREALGLSLIYRWPGRDPEKPAVVLMGHLDVVPIAPGTEGSWTHPCLLYTSPSPRD